MLPIYWFAILSLMSLIFFMMMCVIASIVIPNIYFISSNNNHMTFIKPTSEFIKKKHWL